jgi:putative hydrolase of the HAD superfamily
MDNPRDDKVEALLFDLGRVVLDLDSARAHARWGELAGVPATEIERRARLRVVGSEAFERHERGEISDAAFFAHLRRALEIDLSDAELEDGWNAIFVGEMPGIRPVLCRARQVLPLYAFSNTNTAHQACWSVRFADVLGNFRKIYVSNELGARKPDAAAFGAVARDMGVRPERILFLDDLEENVAGARASGMKAVRVTSTADVGRALGDLAIMVDYEKG